MAGASLSWESGWLSLSLVGEAVVTVCSPRESSTGASAAGGNAVARASEPEEEPPLVARACVVRAAEGSWCEYTSAGMAATGVAVSGVMSSVSGAAL